MAEGASRPPRERRSRETRLAGGDLRGADGLELGLEEVLVDLPLIDRDAFRDAELDDLVALHVELLRELLRRQVIRHRPFPPSANEKARWHQVLSRARSRLVRRVAGV